MSWRINELQEQVPLVALEGIAMAKLFVER
jgi:hypothetical protein